MNKKNIHTKISTLRKGFSSSSHSRISFNTDFIATKFVAWEVTDLKNLETSKVYQLRKKLNEGISLSREEKNWITAEINRNCYFYNAIPLMGWKFDFEDIVNKYLVCQYGRWQEYFAVDKTSLREHLYGRITKIIAL